MPRKYSLAFSQDQEEKLCQYLAAKRNSLMDDNRDRIKIDQEAWEHYFLDVNRRKGIALSIYPLSNIPIPVFGMVVEHFASRMEESTSGEQPYWHFQAVGNNDEEMATTYSNYFEWKLDEGKVHNAMLDSQLPTIIQCASVQKATYARDEIYWVDKNIRVLHDKQTGNPVETISSGPVIEGEDEWEDREDPLGVLGQIGNVISGAFGQEPQPPKMRKHLKADPTIVFNPDRHEWKAPEAGIKRSQVVFQGAKSENVRFDRFYCAMDAASIEVSDVMELQDRTMDWFRNNWYERPWASWANYESQIKSGDSSPKTGSVDTGLGTGNPAMAEKKENRVYDHVNPVRRVAEFWVERDVLGDGKMAPQRFVAWYDIDLNVLVGYEWQGLVCPDLKRPFTVTSLSKEPNRWCGKSIYQRGKPLFESIDRLFNGEFYRTLQQANPPKGGDPGAAKEEPTDIVYDPTKYYELNKGRTIDELIQYAKVPDTNQRTQSVIEFIIFWIQLWLGISNIAQGDYAAVPANNTASGIVKTLQEASMLGRRWIRRKIESDQEHITKLVKIIIATIKEDQREVFEFTNGDQRESAEIMGAEIRTLNIHVKVIEQQHFQEQDIARCKAALATLDPYFKQLNPEVRKIMLPFILEILKELGFKKAPELLVHFEGIPISADMGGAIVQGPDGKPQLPPPEQPEAPPPAESLQPPPPPPPVKGNVSVQVKWEQLTPEERAQMMGELGVKEPPQGPPPEVQPALAPKPHPDQLAHEADIAQQQAEASQASKQPEGGSQ